MEGRSESDLLHLEVQLVPLMKRLFGYLVVGGVAALVDFIGFGLLLYGLSLTWFWAALISFILATFVNYWLSIRFVFRSGVRFKRNHEVALVFLVSSVGLFVNQMTLYVGIGLLYISPVLAKVGATGGVFFWNYLTRSRFIFK